MILGLLAFALAADEPACLDRAIASLRVDPNGFRVWKASGDRAAFGFWLDCDKPDFDVSSAVHETVHLLSGGPSTTRYSYYLVGGDRTEAAIVRTPPRSSVVAGLRADERDGYAATYLSGASGDQGLLLLLDELNAYTHGLVTETALASRRKDDGRRTAARDGLAHFQLYTVLYLQRFREEEPGKFSKVSESHGELVGLLWKQAEVALAASLPHAAVGIDDRWYLARAYDPALLEGLDAFCGGRVWSTTLQKELTRDPPAGPTPIEQLEGKTTSRTSSQRRFRASVRIGGDTWDFEERSPSGEVTLLINGERSPARTWAEVESLALPKTVLDALRESRQGAE